MTKENMVHVDLGTRSYDVHIGEGLLSHIKDFLPFDITDRKIFILYDRNVEQHVEVLKTCFAQTPFTLAMDGGEKTKSYNGLQAVVDWMLANRVDRKSILFVIGGGVMGDLGGFAASVVLRGIPFVQIPTTLLSQVDSSVGGKTGINTAHGKNLVGAFYQPIAVLCDTNVLKTLPLREMKAGYAEIVKYGLLGNRVFFEWLEQHGKNVLALEVDSLTHAIKTSCRMKANVVVGDEFESVGGKRALLNLGHTFGHALEAAAGYDGRLLHGEAVSIGMVLAHRLSVKMGICLGQELSRVEQHLKSCGLMTEISDIKPVLTQSADEIVGLMANDKKASNGKIGFILTRGIGEAFQSSDVDMDDVLGVINDSMI